MNTTRLSVLVLFTLLTSQKIFADDPPSFPGGPDLSLTPGALCVKPDELRYPEQIPYCKRDVSVELKNKVIVQYDRKLGTRIQKMPRLDFKIDHFIPLCAGGSNEESNLWPQHKTIYVQTDQLEQIVCDLMKAGKLDQKEAVEIFQRVKTHTETAQKEIQLLRKMQN